MSAHTANWDHCLQVGAISDVGLRRANNQDAMAVVIAESQETWEKRGHLFMVADGMGAHAAGELASKLATDAIPLSYFKLLDRPPPEAILVATQDANTQIHSRGQASLDFKGMGTTCTGLLLLPQGALVSHVGDSRAYRLRGNRFEQLTFDHSLVWEMRAAGQLPDDSTPSFVPKNIITRSLGPNPSVQVDREGPFPIEVGDTFLLCSDGLSGPVKDDEMGAILLSMPPADAVRALVDLANLRGGPDNITVIVVRVTAPLAAGAGGAASDSSGPVTTRPVHPLLWTLLGMAGLATLGLLVLGNYMAAMASLVATVVALIAAMMQRYGAFGGSTFDGQLLGKGPYRACVCGADTRFIDQLTDIIEQLRQAAVAENWPIDWSRFDGFRQRAAAARQAGNFAQTVRESLAAVNFMLAQLKQQRRATDHESALDL